MVLVVQDYLIQYRESIEAVTPADVAARIVLQSNDATGGGGSLVQDYLFQYRESVEAVTPAAVAAAAQRHLQPDQLTTVVIADADVSDKPTLSILHSLSCILHPTS